MSVERASVRRSGLSRANVHAAPSPADIQNMIRSMWSCEGPPQGSPKEGPNFCSRIHSAEGSSIMTAALPSPAATNAKNGRRAKTSAAKVSQQGLGLHYTLIAQNPMNNPTFPNTSC
jgi:hypothetical protein